MDYKLVICVYGCVTIDKYKKEIETINNSWGKLCNSCAGVKLLYFLGEEKADGFESEEYVYLPGVKNDYLSASYKQFLGLKYIKENYNAEYILCCGTDTYINIPKLLLFINKFNHNENLYIGGHGCHRQIGDETYYFHSGGPGFIITKICLDKLYPLLINIMNDWIQVCEKNNVLELIPSCDVAISYYLQRDVKVKIIKEDSFISCNYMGIPCHKDCIDMSKIVSCHSMSIDDFNNFTTILEVNNYFI